MNAASEKVAEELAALDELHFSFLASGKALERLRRAIDKAGVRRSLAFFGYAAAAAVDARLERGSAVQAHGRAD